MSGSAPTGPDLHAQYRALLQRLEANEGEFRRLGRSVWRVQEDERKRLARELHDGIGQNLTALKHQLALLGSALGPGNAPLRERVDAAIGLCASTLDDTRQLSRLLRPPILDDLGLVPALRWLARNIEQGGGPEVMLEADALDGIDPDLQTLLFRFVQEALNNAAKHAHARQARVLLQARGGSIRLRVEDDGAGFDPARVQPGSGSGLGGMQERLRLYGGHFHLESAPGEGTRIDAIVPIDD
ncbi:sensor histidine kinase [Luteimonas vadosa]|uniref:Oxygen sensor histidine kinase NreB n=1 Tax=Luteimonas vadosa TaxID=1165507 RepID=A0ABP9DRA5_9GAMM